MNAGLYGGALKSHPMSDQQGLFPVRQRLIIRKTKAERLKEKVRLLIRPKSKPADFRTRVRAVLEAFQLSGELGSGKVAQKNKTVPQRWLKTKQG